jgi:hypothetical protein
LEVGKNLFQPRHIPNENLNDVHGQLRLPQEYQTRGKGSHRFHVTRRITNEQEAVIFLQVQALGDGFIGHNGSPRDFDLSE